MRARLSAFARLGLALGVLLGGDPASRAEGPAPPHGEADAAGRGGRIAFTMGEIGRRAAYGQDGSWVRAASVEGSLDFTNRADPSSWTATTTHPPGLPYTVQVEVNSGIEAAEGEAMGAGIVFAFHRGAGASTYYAVMVAGDSIALYRYDGEFTRTVQVSGPRGGQSGRWDALRVSVRDGGFALALNGRQFASVEPGTPLSGDVGVIVSGRGTASFRNLEIH